MGVLEVAAFSLVSPHQHSLLRARVHLELSMLSLQLFLQALQEEQRRKLLGVLRQVQLLTQRSPQLKKNFNSLWHLLAHYQPTTLQSQSEIPRFTFYIVNG